MKKWRSYPSAHRDITLAIYSKQTLDILDESGNNYQEHYDGSLPTGFTESTYRNGVNYDDLDNKDNGDDTIVILSSEEPEDDE